MSSEIKKTAGRLSGPEKLDDFVTQTDALGGPGSPKCTEYWASFEYLPKIQIDQNLDPYGEEYVAAQLSLYEEISGRKFDQLKNEHTEFDVARHKTAVNPYDHPDPSGLAMHIERLSRAFRFAKLKRNAHLLDLGCGWGLSSEVAAYLGLKVTAVDINPVFVELVNHRAESGRRNIQAISANFESFNSSDSYDAIFFYECLHHALKPWDIVNKFAMTLAPEGKIILAGEPINQHWWKNWGLRLDPISVYCIRKFGWFESGWSLYFIQDIFIKAGLHPQIDHSSDNDVGYTVVGVLPTSNTISATDIYRWQNSGWLLDGDFLTLTGEASLSIPFTKNNKRAQLHLRSFRPSNEIKLFVSAGETVYFDGIIPANSDQFINIDAPTIGLLRLNFKGEIWIPNEEIHNGDTRIISCHLAAITIQ